MPKPFFSFRRDTTPSSGRTGDAKRRLFGSRRAFVTVYIVFSTLTLIPVVGLAIDFSILYNVKGRLQAACDAAAVGAGSLVQRSTDVTDPTTIAAIQASILRYFNANFRPAPWRSSQASYSSTVTQDTNKVRTITVTATYNVPMEFMRVLGINNSQVGAQAIAKIRFVNMIVVVDRSGSVSRTGGVGGVPNPTIIKNDLNQFVANSSSSIFVDGRDVVGLTSFGGNYNVDYGAQTHFQTATPNIGTAVNNLFFDTSNSTNTGEGLYKAWYQITQLNQPGSLNVILLMTDGRPSAFTADFNASSAPYCTDKTDKHGVITSPVSDGNPWQFPPPSSRTTSGIIKATPECTTGGCEPSSFVTNSAGCKYFTTSATDAYMDFPTIPALLGPQDHNTGSPLPGTTTFNSTTGYFSGGGSNLQNATAEIPGS